MLELASHLPARRFRTAFHNQTMFRARLGIAAVVDSPATATIEIIRRLTRLYPHYGQAELLRLALLLSLHHPEVQAERSEAELRAVCQEIVLQCSAAGDQHAAVADELDSLAATAPCEFSPQHVFTLVRAIKVQSQVLNLYLGPVEANS
jgi:hypothetical protein